MVNLAPLLDTTGVRRTLRRLAHEIVEANQGVEGLVLVGIDPDALGDALRWEKSRRDMEFPHLYGTLPLEAVRSTWDLPVGDDGLHVFPAFL